MLKYLIILLDDASISFCHYNVKKPARLIDKETLRKGILFGMKENLNIQFIFPSTVMPKAQEELIETVDHTKIMPASQCNGADVVVYDNWDELENTEGNITCVIRTSRKDLFNHKDALKSILKKVARLNIVITDIEKFTDSDFEAYRSLLEQWRIIVKDLFAMGKTSQLNVLTDRIMLDKMNNCGAGDESITFAPDGKFYLCPSFYQEDAFCIGDIDRGLDIKNQHLYKLDHAPICRHCDAYQCKRCIWLNQKTTLEVNTPSHEQCVVAHIERESSRKLLADIRTLGDFMPQQEIKEIDYMDPFENRKKW